LKKLFLFFSNMFVALLSLIDGRIADRLMPEAEYWSQWKEFLAGHGGMARYASKAEHDDRFEIFKANMDKAKVHNESEKGKKYTLGITPFADKTYEEFSAFVKMSGTMERKPDSERNIADLSGVEVLASKDWRDDGAVTPVKNQGQCGSCWSFSATGSMEGAYFNKNGVLKSFSEQQLVDCSTLNHGCNGGSMDLAFMYTESSALEEESNYPYEAEQKACRYVKSLGVASATSYEDVSARSSYALKAALSSKGPVSVAIEADTEVFQLYTGGVLDSDACGTSLDHGVLAVGYNSMNGEEYYIVKNSWGGTWGVGGYVNIGIEDGDGICGIQDMASYPTM